MKQKISFLKEWSLRPTIFLFLLIAYSPAVFAQASAWSIFGASGSGCTATSPISFAMNATISPPASGSFSGIKALADHYTISAGNPLPAAHSVYTPTGQLLFSVDQNGIYEPVAGGMVYDFSGSYNDGTYPFGALYGMIFPTGGSSEQLVPGQAASEVCTFPCVVAPDNSNYWVVFWDYTSTSGGLIENVFLRALKVNLGTGTPVVTLDTFLSDFSSSTTAPGFDITSDADFNVAIAADAAPCNGSSRDVYTLEEYTDYYTDNKNVNLRKWTFPGDGSFPAPTAVAPTYQGNAVNRPAYSPQAKILSVGGTKYFTYTTTSSVLAAPQMNVLAMWPIASPSTGPTYYTFGVGGAENNINGFEVATVSGTSYLYASVSSYSLYYDSFLTAYSGLEYYNLTTPGGLNSISPTSDFAGTDLEVDGAGDLFMVSSSGNLAYLSGGAPGGTVSLVSNSCGGHYSVANTLSSYVNNTKGQPSALYLTKQYQYEGVGPLQITGIDINTRCAPGYGDPGLSNPTYTVSTAGGAGTLSYLWTPATLIGVGGPTIQLNNAILQSYSTPNNTNTIIGLGPAVGFGSLNADFWLTVNDANGCKATMQVRNTLITSGPDLASKDSPFDLYNESNDQLAATGFSDYWSGPDVWNRTAEDGLVSGNQSNETPTYHTITGVVQNNYLYVKVRNVGCHKYYNAPYGPDGLIGTLNSYWTTGAGSTEVWPFAWTPPAFGGSTEAPYCGSGTLAMGGYAQVSSSGATPPELPIEMAAGTYTVIETPWIPPNPALYYPSCTPGYVVQSLCFLSRIVDYHQVTSCSEEGMTFCETSGDITTNITNNNNIASLNTGIMAIPPSPSHHRYVITVGNGETAATTFSMQFINGVNLSPQGGTSTLSNYARMKVFLGPLYSIWQSAGGHGTYLAADAEEQSVTFDGTNTMRLDSITLDSGARYSVFIEANFLPNVNGQQMPCEKVYFRQLYFGRPANAIIDSGYIATVDSSYDTTSSTMLYDTVYTTAYDTTYVKDTVYGNFSYKVMYQTPLPNIQGITTLCVGSTTSLTDSVAEGIWSIDPADSAVASVVDSSGVLTGISAGTATVFYTLRDNYAMRIITVNPLPAAITGMAIVCRGATTNLSDTSAGGAWTTADTLTATVSSAGAVMGLNTGTATITYGDTATGCAAIAIVTVIAMPAAIANNSLICLPGAITLSDATSGGTWTSGNTGVATIGSASGTVNGVNTGTALITYTVMGKGCHIHATVTVNTLPSAGTITGAGAVCVSATTALSDGVTGGAWSATNTAVGTVNTSGVVSGIAQGTTTISYTVTNACGSTAATGIVTVNPLPIGGTVMGAGAVCAGAITSLSDAATGGVWSSANSNASVDVWGNVSGETAGTSTISYTVANGCGTVTATAVVTVNPLPIGGTVTGVGAVCAGSITILSDATTDGVWSSSNSNATVDGSGNVSGITAGTATLSYTVTNGCGTANATAIVTVNPLAVAGTINGTATVCAGSITVLSDATTGGAWSSGNSNATVDGSGNVSGVTAGTATISYTITNGCGNASAVNVVTVNPIPTAGSIGGASTVVVSLTTTLTDAVTGGVWSASNTKATVGSTTGVVTGVTAGTVTISYTVATGCGTVTATYPMTVNAVGAISGTTYICVGPTTTLTDAPSGGTWHSTNAFIASINSSGVLTGVASGTATISYTVSGATATVIVTVNNDPSGIGGSSSVCNGTSITLSDFVSGGTWTGTSGLSVTNGTATAITTVTGLTVGTNSVSYTLADGCYAAYTVTVKALPTPILGDLSVCGIGSVTFLSDLTTTTSWASSAVGTATVNAAGRVYGVAAGTAIITFTAPNTCITTAIVTVNTLVTLPAISGASSVAHGSTITLSDATSGGVWSSSNPSLGSVDASGDVTGVGTTGTVTITYTLAYGSGCTATATKAVTVHTPAPPHANGGSTSIGVGDIVSLSDDIPGGLWSSSDNNIATVDVLGIAMGIAPGVVSIIHAVTNSDGTASTKVTELVVGSSPFEVRLTPNPNRGTFNLTGTIGTDRDEAVTLEITDILGQVIYTGKCIAEGGTIKEQIMLRNGLPNGTYLLNIHATVGSKVVHFVVER